LFATNVTTPVAWLIDQAPSLFVSPVTQVFGVTLVFTKHVADAPEIARPVPVARPEPPVTLVNDTVPPGRTDLVSGVADGALIGSTLGVIVEFTVRFKVSVT
jgi:hypothetical protein